MHHSRESCNKRDKGPVICSKGKVSFFALLINIRKYEEYLFVGNSDIYSCQL